MRDNRCLLAKDLLGLASRPLAPEVDPDSLLLSPAFDLGAEAQTAFFLLHQRVHLTAIGWVCLSRGNTSLAGVKPQNTLS